MFNFITTKSMAAVAAAAIVAGLAVGLTSIGPEAKAEPHIKGALHQPHAKADRVPARLHGAACSSRGWPHYEQSCQFDPRRPANETRTVRVIALR